MSAMNPAGDDQYRVPPEPSRWPAIALAVAVHACLLAFLWIGISWQNTDPVAVEAEVWDMKTRAAAPPPPPPEESEPVASQPPPTPAPAPAPAPKVAPPPIEQPVTPKPPDIALEREKRKAEKLKKEAEERKERELADKQERARELAEKKARDQAEKRDQELAEKKLAEKKLAEKKLAEKKEAEKKLAEKKDAEKKDAEKKQSEKLAADKKKAEKLAREKEAAEDQKKLDKLRDLEMRRIAGAAGSTGSAEKSTAPRMDSGYRAAIAGKVKSAANYSGSTDTPGNPRVEFQIEQLPTGEIISVKKTKSSGVPGFDEAVEKAIIKSSPLPKKKDGTVERSFPIGFSMKDLD